MRKLFLGLLLATVAICVAPQTAYAQAGAPQPTPGVEAQVSKLQWRRSVDPATSYKDVSGSLYVVTGTSLIFRAVKDDDTKAWPSGKPAWSGTSGASGTGETKSVTFSTRSSSATDYKTVVAYTIDTDKITANVVVCDVTPTTTADDTWTGRSTTSFGITEKGKCVAQVAPSGVTPSQIGSMQWVKGGSGYLGATTDGKSDLVCGTINESLTLTLKILSGPSQDQTIAPLTRSVVLPNAGYVVQKPGTGKRHTVNVYSAGFLGELSIGPKNVSFKGLGFREGTIADSSVPPKPDTSIPGNIEVRSTATGWFLSMGASNYLHMMGSQTLILDGASGNKVDGTDTIDSGDIAPGSTSFFDNKTTVPPYANGTFNWPITWFIQPTGGNWTYFVTVNHTMNSDALGKATIQKGSASVSAALSELTQTP